VTASGGTGAYTYSWSPAGGASATASALCAGNYTCYIRDASNCLITQTDTIRAPSALVVIPSQTNVSCNGNHTGAATATVSGGTAGYMYNWVPSGGTTATATALAAGTYTCTINDANACSTIQTFTVTQPSLLSAIASQNNVNCNGASTGIATYTASGGTSAYTYSWSPSGGNGAAATGLIAGTYTCFVNDAMGCLLNQVFTLNQPPVLAAAGSNVSSTCQLANGSASAIINGGSGSYTYSWFPSGGNGSLASGLDSGVYVCTIYDSLGCSATVIDTVKNVGYLPGVFLSAGGPTTFCIGGNVTLTASGGTTYSWNTGALTPSITVNAAGVYAVTATNVCGNKSTTDTVKVKPQPNPVITGINMLCSGTAGILTATGGTSYSWSTGATSDTIHVVTGGIYSVAVTNSCGTAITQDTVKADAVTALFTPDTHSGTAPLPVNFINNSSVNAISFAWVFGDGATGTSAAPTHNYSAAGTYTVLLTVTDANGCMSTWSDVIIVKDIISWIIVPNVFTPNGDGSNDVFAIKYQGISEFSMKIYDRWGVMIAQLYSPAQTWDGYTLAGEKASDGTYYYLLHANGDDGKTYDLKGFVMMMGN
jgi:gliding motility-associated-like protein